MATISGASASPSQSLAGRRYDHAFFETMAVLFAATVFLGFSHTYYSAGVFRAPLASRILHIHGAIFSTWIILLAVQATLVTSGQVRIHRRLGIAGMFIAGLVVIFGILAAGDSMARLGSRATSLALSFSITPFTDMLVFAMLAGSAFYLRRDSPTHKRLIVLATIAMMRAAIVRWPFAFVFHSQGKAILISYLFVVMLLVYDLWSTHKIHRATLWGTAFLVVVHAVRIPIGQTETWHSFARWFG
jgi:hypothetical protein